MPDNWLVVEIHCEQAGGVRIHDYGREVWIIGGVEQWEWSCRNRIAGVRSKPSWGLPPFDLDPEVPTSHVLSGDMSPTGTIALVRRTSDYGCLQVFRLHDGHVMWQRNVCPLAAGWSHNGDVLAVLQWRGVPDYTTTDDNAERSDVELVLYDPSGRVLETWVLGFEPFILPWGGDWMNNRFAISWSSDDQHMIVSTKKVVKNDMRPRTYVLNVRSGPVDCVALSDAYFVGASRFVANESGKWSEAGFFDIATGQVRKTQAIRRRLFAAGSDAQDGVFLAYMPPAGFPRLRFALEIALLDSDGRVSAAGMSEYAHGSCIRFVQSDSPLAGALRALAIPDDQAGIPTSQ